MRNQIKSVSCVHHRAVQCWSSVWCPLRPRWRGCSTPACSCWTTCAARGQQLRWTQASCAWGVSRSTSGLCPLSSSRGRSGANPCLLWSRAATNRRDDGVNLMCGENWKQQCALVQGGQTRMKAALHDHKYKDTHGHIILCSLEFLGLAPVCTVTPQTDIYLKLNLRITNHKTMCRGLLLKG